MKSRSTNFFGAFKKTSSEISDLVPLDEKEIYVFDSSSQHSSSSYPLKFECKICHKLFSRKGALKLHFTEIHDRNYKENFNSAVLLEIPNIFSSSFPFHSDDNDVRPFDCPKCSKSYKARTSLRRHIKFECGVEPQFQCTICGFRFKQKCDLKKHFHERHVEDSDVFSCSFCDYRTKRKSTLKQHLLVKHTDNFT